MATIGDKRIVNACALLRKYGVPEEKAMAIAEDVADWARVHVYNNGLIGKLDFVFDTKIMQLCNNFDPESHVNKPAGNGILSNRPDMNNIDGGKYEPEDIRPDIWKPHIDEYEQKEELVWTRECETVDTEECPQCGKREAWVYTMQLRSLDEGTTKRVVCKPCGNAWTHNN